MPVWPKASSCSGPVRLCQPIWRRSTGRLNLPLGNSCRSAEFQIVAKNCPGVRAVTSNDKDRRSRHLPESTPIVACFSTTHDVSYKSCAVMPWIGHPISIGSGGRGRHEQDCRADPFFVTAIRKSPGRHTEISRRRVLAVKNQNLGLRGIYLLPEPCSVIVSVSKRGITTTRKLDNVG